MEQDKTDKLIGLLKWLNTGENPAAMKTSCDKIGYCCFTPES